jgi:hypothetical protein
MTHRGTQLLAQQTLVMIICILMDFIVELPCKHQKCSEHFMVIYDIVIKPLLFYVCDHCMGS